MFVVTLNRTRLRQIGVGVMCCAMVVCSALLGRYISNQTVAAAGRHRWQNRVGPGYPDLVHRLWH